MGKILLNTLSLSLSAGVALAETTVQSCNRTVTFDAPPERAISNDVNLTEMMLVLGLADRMVGYTGISGWKTLDEDMRAGVEELRNEGRRRGHTRDPVSLWHSSLRADRVLHTYHGQGTCQHRRYVR